MTEINNDGAKIALSTGQELLKVVLGAVAGYAASKASDKAFIKIVTVQRMKKVAAVVTQ